jgi:hypothetical protein
MKAGRGGEEAGMKRSRCLRGHLEPLVPWFKEQHREVGTQGLGSAVAQIFLPPFFSHVI